MTAEPTPDKKPRSVENLNRGGRPKGTPNKVTAEIRAAAQVYGEEALTTLATLMRECDNPSVRVAAAKELLDRGYGRSAQHVELTGKDGKELAAPISPTEFCREMLFELELAQREKPSQHVTTQH